MAPLPVRPLLVALTVAVVMAGCSADTGDRTDVADTTASAPAATQSPTPSPSPSPSAAHESPGPTTPAPSDTPAVPNPPDLSGATIDCGVVTTPCDHGDDPDLDRLWDACAAGDGWACDRLYYDSAFDTRYEQFGNTCGDRGLTIPCPDDLAS